jgi:hypothetical protein
MDYLLVSRLAPNFLPQAGQKGEGDDRTAPVRPRFWWRTNPLSRHGCALEGLVYSPDQFSDRGWIALRRKGRCAGKESGFPNLRLTEILANARQLCS